MRRKYNRKKSQSTLEYAILIAVIAAVLLTIQVYFKRAAQGRIRSSADDIGEQFSTAGTLQVTTNSYSRTNEVVLKQESSSRLLNREWLNRYENLQLLGYNEDYWGSSGT